MSRYLSWKQCNYCFGLFSTTLDRQIYCSANCRTLATKERQANNRKTVVPRRKSCASSGCSNLVSANLDSIYCSSCFYTNSDLEKDLRKIKRYSGA